jgi:dTDP-4-amino-4,6-dideoxygalactose transaminase
MDSGSFILGEEVRKFETEFADYIGNDSHAISVGSGTDAIEIALRALNIGPGNIVITVPNTAVATVSAIEAVGAEPFLVDVDDETMTMDADRLRNVLDKVKRREIPSVTFDMIKAIIPVHLYGQAANIASICNIARENELFVIEDCSQAHGAKVDGINVGTFGDFGTFSFYPTKNLGGFGDGGALVTKNSSLATKTKLLRQYGWGFERNNSLISGVNSRLDELQAAFLRVRLNKLDKENLLRSSFAEIYNKELSNEDVRIPCVRKGSTSVYHQYVIRVSKRDGLKDFLERNGVPAAIHYPLPIHKQTNYVDQGIKYDNLEISENISKEILSLPNHPYLKEDDIRSIILIIKNYLNKKRY